MNLERQSVLFVDDEEYVLKALRRCCRQEEFQVFTCCSGNEALEILDKQKIDLIVSDLRMPNMDGVSLLAQVSERFPDMPRIILSGNADLPSVIKTVNEGQLSYYFQKPWDDDAFRLTLREFLQRKRLEEQQAELLSTVSSQNKYLSELNQKLEDQAAEVQAASEMKDKFLAVMSHEIRTPLNGLMGVMQILADEDLDEQQERLVETGLSVANDLNRITTDVLDFSKLESDAMSLESIPFCLKEVVTGVFDLMKPVAEKKAIRLQVTNESGLRQTRIGDPVRVRQIIANLVSNAIKYTDAGYVSITVEDRGSDIVIIVEDSGIGISAEGKKVLFDEFSMLDASHARKYGGTGLGLSIVKRLAEQMNGTAVVESELGVGSRFEVVLPLACVEEYKPRKNTDLGDIDKKVLVIDDNETNLLIAESILVKYGMQVETAGNGNEALALLRSKEFADSIDTILMDINMPDLDGIEVMAIMRDEKLCPIVPVIALTANVHPEQILGFHEAGFSACVSKPFRAFDLVTSIVDTLPEPGAPGHFCGQALNELREETGDEVVEKLIEAYIRECTKRLVSIDSARQCAKSDVIVREAHALSSSAAMLGDTKLYEMCTRVQEKHHRALAILDEGDTLSELISYSIEQFGQWSQRQLSE